MRLTYAELYDSVARLAKSLREMGIRAGDRVVGFMPNIPETIIAMLASTSIGALWSSCSPDFGIKGVLDRFGQIEPKVIFTAHGYRYNGQYFDSLERITGIIKDLPSVEKVVIVPYPDEEHDINKVPHAISYNDFASQEDNLIIHFEQLPFDHPLYIMYSSGTTGLPKCLVQGAGGILINHMKELMLHTDLKREDKIFYFTTCGWMMWNWLVSSLAIGATLMLYDGSPFYPHHGALFTLAEDEKMTIFGTSARYLATIEKKGVKPSAAAGMEALQHFYRFFPYPNNGHCRGGSGPQINTDDLFDALVDWVENGIAPDYIVASQDLGDGVIRTRKICKYPDVLVYMDTGDTDDHNSFYCEERFEDDPALLAADVLGKP